MADQVPFPALRRAALWLAVCGVPLSRPAPESSRAGHHVLSTVDDKSGASRRSQQYLLVWSDSLKLHSAVLGTKSINFGNLHVAKTGFIQIGAHLWAQITCYNRTRMAGEEFSKYWQWQTCFSGSKTPRYAQSHQMPVIDKKPHNLKTAQLHVGDSLISNSSHR